MFALSLIRACCGYTDEKTDTVGGCAGMRSSGKGGRKVEIEVRYLPRDRLPSVHTVHVRATSKSRRPLRASMTFVVVDEPLVLTIRSVGTGQSVVAFFLSPRRDREKYSSES